MHNTVFNHHGIFVVPGELVIKVVHRVTHRQVERNLHPLRTASEVHPEQVLLWQLLQAASARPNPESMESVVSMAIQTILKWTQQ